MHELIDAQPLIYRFSKMGLGQMWVLCGSVVLPHVYYEADMQRAANELFRINESLRTRFVESEDGNVYQETKPFQERKFDVLSFESFEEMSAWADTYATIPLELDVRSEGKGIPKKAWSTGAPTAPSMIYKALAHEAATAYKKVRLGVHPKPDCCEVKLVQLPGATGAIIKLHHIVSDAWSMTLMAQQFIQLLNGEQPVVYQYDEHARNDEKYKSSKAYQRDLAFFNGMIERMPSSTPLWSKPVTGMVAERRTTVLDEDLSAQLRSYSEAQNTSPYILFLTAAGAYVRQKIGSDEFYFVSTCGNRAGAHERNTVGLFASGPILDVTMNGSDTFQDAVASIAASNLASLRHQRAFSTISKTFDTTSRTSLTFSYQEGSLGLDPDVICTQHFCEYWPYALLSIEDRASDGQFKLHLDCNLELASVEESNELIDFMIRVLRAGIVDDSKTIDELSK